MEENREKTEKSENNYDKMQDYIESIFSVFSSLHKKAQNNNNKNKKMQMICLVIYNYLNKIAKENDVSIKDLKEPETINLIPFFEYISYNNIELYDFTKIDVADVDITKKSDLERFVLTHIYYLTQPK